MGSWKGPAGPPIGWMRATPPGVTCSPNEKTLAGIWWSGPLPGESPLDHRFCGPAKHALHSAKMSARIAPPAIAGYLKPLLPCLQEGCPESRWRKSLAFPSRRVLARRGQAFGLSLSWFSSLTHFAHNRCFSRRNSSKRSFSIA